MKTINTLFVSLALASASASGQFTDPLPSGIAVEVEPWLTIPASSGSAPRARINHVKPTPGEARLFRNDLRGKLWSIANPEATSATMFLDLAEHFPLFVDSPGLGTGFASFAFHPEFRQPGALGYGKFYTAHSESSGGTVADFAGLPARASASSMSLPNGRWTILRTAPLSLRPPTSPTAC